MTRARIVVDTNVLVSRLLFPSSLPGQALSHVLEAAQLLISDDLLAELFGVLARPKFDAYVTMSNRVEFVRSLRFIAEVVPIDERVDECRDTKDNIVLELAVNGNSAIIVTGDRDLLAMNGFRGIKILTPAEYLASS